MKTINNINANTLTAVSAAASAKAAADKAYKEAKTALATAVADYLKDAPDGTQVLNLDLANAAGLAPSHVAAIISSEGYALGVRSDSVRVRKHYAEVDENGQLIEGGDTKEVVRDLCAFRKVNKRGW